MGEKWFVKTKKPGRADCLFHFIVRKQKHRSALTVLTQAWRPAGSGCLLRARNNKNSLLLIKKPRLRVVFKWLALKDSASGRFVDSKRLQPGLAVFALRTAVPFYSA